MFEAFEPRWHTSQGPYTFAMLTVTFNLLSSRTNSCTNLCIFITQKHYTLYKHSNSQENKYKYKKKTQLHYLQQEPLAALSAAPSITTSIARRA